MITLAPWGANARDSWPIGPLATLTQFCQRCQSSSVLRWRGLSCAAQNTGKACPDGAAGDGLFGAHPDTGEDTYLMQLSLRGLYAPDGVTEPGVDFLGCVDIDDCLSNPCGVGTCTDTFETDAKANSYTCACPDGLIWDELAPQGESQCIHTDTCTTAQVCSREVVVLITPGSLRHLSRFAD